MQFVLQGIEFKWSSTYNIFLADWNSGNVKMPIAIFCKSKHWLQNCICTYVWWPWISLSQKQFQISWMLKSTHRQITNTFSRAFILNIWLDSNSIHYLPRKMWYKYGVDLLMYSIAALLVLDYRYPKVG